MDRLDAMAVLIATVDAGSFSGASRTLGSPLPTVSRKISELENHLQTRLLIRSTRKLSLTDAGAAYVTAARRILEQVHEAERTAAGEYATPKGDLVVTAPIVFGRLHVLPAVTDFLARFPAVNVRLTLSDRNAPLVDDHIDLAVRIGELPDSSLVATRIGAVRQVICGSPAYFAGHGVPKTPDDLKAHTLIAFDATGSALPWTFAKPGGKTAQSVAVQSRLSVNTAEAAIDSAAAGIGITRVISYQAMPAVKDGKLQIVLSDYEPAPMPVHVLHVAQGLLPLKMRGFLDFVVPFLRARLDPKNPPRS